MFAFRNRGFIFALLVIFPQIPGFPDLIASALYAANLIPFSRPRKEVILRYFLEITAYVFVGIRSPNMLAN